MFLMVGFNLVVGSMTMILNLLRSDWTGLNQPSCSIILKMNKQLLDRVVRNEIKDSTYLNVKYKLIKLVFYV